MKPVIIIAIIIVLAVVVVGLLMNLTSAERNTCSGNARCITGTVTQVIDGDTLKVDGQSIRFALASAPEMNEF